MQRGPRGGGWAQLAALAPTYRRGRWQLHGLGALACQPRSTPCQPSCMEPGGKPPRRPSSGSRERVGLALSAHPCTRSQGRNPLVARVRAGTSPGPAGGGKCSGAPPCPAQRIEAATASAPTAPAALPATAAARGHRARLAAPQPWNRAVGSKRHAKNASPLGMPVCACHREGARQNGAATPARNGCATKARGRADARPRRGAEVPQITDHLELVSLQL